MLGSAQELEILPGQGGPDFHSLYLEQSPGTPDPQGSGNLWWPGIPPFMAVPSQVSPQILWASNSMLPFIPCQRQMLHLQTLLPFSFPFLYLFIACAKDQNSLSL